MKRFRTLLGVMAATSLAAPAAQAVVISYDLAGISNVGSQSHRFVGVFSYDDAAPTSTVYLTATGASSAQGFITQYIGALLELSISLDNGESVKVSPGGGLSFSNYQQYELGIPGLTLDARSSGATGTINGQPISNMYLSFATVASNFTWDALDTLLGGGAEQKLQANPSLLPAAVGPALTGTALPADLPSVFKSGQFVGVNFATTNAVLTVTSIVRHTSVVPEPASWALMLVGAAFLAGRRGIARSI